jgi:hypothetical protein
LRTCLHWTLFFLLQIFPPFCSVHMIVGRDNVLVTSISELLTEGKWDWTVVQLLATRRVPCVVSCQISFNCILCPQYINGLVIQWIADKGKVKVIARQAEVAQGVLGRLRPRIFLTFGTTRVVGRQPFAPTAFTPGEIPGTHFQGLSWPQGTWFHWGEPRKKSPMTSPGPAD